MRGNGAGRLATAGSELLVGIGGGFFVGRWVDAHLGTTPWGLVVGILGGFVVGLWAAYRAATGR